MSLHSTRVMLGAAASLGEIRSRGGVGHGISRDGRQDHARIYTEVMEKAVTVGTMCLEK